MSLAIHRRSRTERSEAVRAALKRAQVDPTITQLLGTPITIQPGVAGSVTHDETGWTEVQFRVPVSGPNGKAVINAIGGHYSNDDGWAFNPLEVIAEEQHKTVDLLTGKTAVAEPGDYPELHKEPARLPEYVMAGVPLASMDGTYPCVHAPVTGDVVNVSLGRCQTPVGLNQHLDEFITDLRYGAFVLQQSDLALQDETHVVLTRSYRSDDWLGANRSHAFGNNANHPYDATLLGSRNPYTYLDLVLGDGEFLRFDRISSGTGYADAVYQHSETSTRFYKATVRWNGDGWALNLADGSRVEFPESYQASNLAQGAAKLMVDSSGNKLLLQRDQQRNLQEIVAPDRSTMKFTYDQESRIVEVADGQGKWARYTYQNGFLTDVVLSSRLERHYGYRSGLMTTVADEHGSTLLLNTYTRRLLTRQEYAGGKVVQYDYKFDATRHYVEKVLITLPDHTSHVLEVDGVPEAVRDGKPA